MSEQEETDRTGGKGKKPQYKSSPGEDWREDDDRARSAEFARILEQFESSREAETPPVGHQVHGRIVQIGEETSFVDFGGRSEGALATLFLRDEEGNLTAQVGDMIDLYVVDNKDQVVLAPSVRAEPTAALSQVLDARRTGMPVTGRVTGMNAGGLEVDVAGLRGFCPVSQVDAGYCPDPSVYLGRTLQFLVSEVGEGGRKLVLSRKALLRREEEEAARRLLASLQPGTEIDGTVSRLESFGAFVDLGGVDGLVHVSEIRYERTEHPSEVLSVGQKVRVKVLDVKDAQGGRPRISLSIRAAAPDPWDEAEERYWPGRRVQGIVVRLTDFGAFVNLSPGIDGLVHVSEVDLKPVRHARDVLKAGQPVDVVVLSIDREKRRISLSIKDALAADQASPEGTAAGASTAEPKSPAAGDLAEGWVAGIKPYGLFVDLPAYGHRARGLVPFEETGEKPGTDLARRFHVGDALRVEITDVDAEGKIRLSMVRAKQRAEQAEFEHYRKAAQAPKANTAMADALRRAIEGKKQG
jgi:small subunit ribosomal protein S1